MQESLVLVLNCGSSSIKFAVINPETGENKLSGLAQCIGTADASLQWKQAGNKQEKLLKHVDYQAAIDEIVDLIHNSDGLEEKLIAVGHRVVHGGEEFTESVIIDEKLLEAVRACSRLAPLHNPANITGIVSAEKAYPYLPQVAVFDTAFHQTMPEHAYIYAIPYQLYKEHGVRRYGFHGTSHRFVTQKAAQILGKPLEECAFISAHLGNGCSIAAVLNGKSVDTSMGLTPLEGLVMGTRSGDVDPSLHAFLADVLGYDVHKVTKMLNKESGLLGISQVNSDMRAIWKAIDEGNELAKLAVDIFCYRLAKYVMAYMIPLGRLDALIFTGGIGENDEGVRAKVVEWLKVIGFKLDEKQNLIRGRDTNGIITCKDSPIAIVVPTNEELLIAQDAARLVV